MELYYVIGFYFSFCLGFVIQKLIHKYDLTELFLSLGPLLAIIVSILIYSFQRQYTEKVRKDDDAHKLRSELREYFIVNIKPIISSILENQTNEYNIYVNQVDENNNKISDDKTIKYPNKINQFSKLIYTMQPMSNYSLLIKHELYWFRFQRYINLLKHCHELYNNYLENIKDPCHSKQIDEWFKQIDEWFKQIDEQIDITLVNLELILFISNFEDDKKEFELFAEQLNKIIMASGLFNEESLFNLEYLEFKLEEDYSRNK
ncbi:MAG: hypothetical protein ACRCV0_02595 [Brevinema sp.]